MAQWADRWPEERLPVLWHMGHHFRNQGCLLYHAAHPGREHAEVWQLWCSRENVIHLSPFQCSVAASQTTPNLAAYSTLLWRLLVLRIGWAQLGGSCLGFLLWMQSDDSGVGVSWGLEHPGGLTHVTGSWYSCPFLATLLYGYTIFFLTSPYWWAYR